MDSIKIRGGNPLQGTINISGSKNACLPIMAASILTDEVLELHNVPKLSDINTMTQLLQSLGASIESKESGDSLIVSIGCGEIVNQVAPYDIVRKMRASIWSLGPLLARFGKAKVSLPGGCAIGARLVDLHIDALKALGADIEISEGYINASIPRFEQDKGVRLKGANFTFAKKSVGATINAALAASLATGETILRNCASEPEITDLFQCLNAMGAKIEGIGTETLHINGVERLHGCSYIIIPDRIEAGTYMIAACITKGNLTLNGISPKLVENLIGPLERAGAVITRGENNVVVSASNGINPVNISTAPYPGFATDLQAQFMSLMTISTGTAEISENIFENRFMHVPELARMGADISIEANRAIIRGVKSLKGAEVMASDLRASVSLILAGLAAEGETVIRRVYHLDRGYQSLEKKLSACGAEIVRVQ